MLAKLRDMLRGARKIEFIILVIVIALAGLCLAGGDSVTGSNPETELEARMKSLLSYIDGAQDARVMITSSEDGTITGVVVVSGGATDVQTRIKIQNAVRTLLDIDLSKIGIIGR